MKIIVSACLLGENCRYDGDNNLLASLTSNLKDFELIPICPEVLGGLPTPRPSAEIISDKVITNSGKDVTKEFLLGAEKTLSIAIENNSTVAILKEKSPSCGSLKIYNGSFSRVLIDGEGITAKLLRESGIVVLNELNYLEYFKKILQKDYPY